MVVDLKLEKFINTNLTRSLKFKYCSSVYRPDRTLKRPETVMTSPQCELILEVSIERCFKLSIISLLKPPRSKPRLSEVRIYNLIICSSVCRPDRKLKRPETVKTLCLMLEVSIERRFDLQSSLYLDLRKKLRGWKVKVT